MSVRVNCPYGCGGVLGHDDSPSCDPGHPYHEACTYCWGRYQALVRRYNRVEEALRGMLLCFDSLSDADISALGMKRSSVCVVEARKALGESPT